MILIAIVLFAILTATPLAFFSMLFLGNLGIHLGFVDLLPGAIAVRIAITSLTTTKAG